MYCIISEMNACLIVIERVFIRGSSYVASLEPVPFIGTVDYCRQNIMADVEFSSVVEEGLLYVLLQDKGL